MPWSSFSECISKNVLILLALLIDSLAERLLLNYKSHFSQISAFEYVMSLMRSCFPFIRGNKWRIWGSSLYLNLCLDVFFVLHSCSLYSVCPFKLRMHVFISQIYFSNYPFDNFLKYFLSEKRENPFSLKDCTSPS